MTQVLLQEKQEFTKTKEDYRNYTNSDRQSKVEATYKENHEKQTLEYVLEQKKITKERIQKGSFQMTFWEAMDKLDQIVDDSDPDASFTQSIHSFQTAEMIRKDHPDKDWLALVGLIHDMGKVLILLGYQQWEVVGDTFVVGCKHDKNIVFHKHFENNPDIKDEKLNSLNGIYEPNCGLDNLHFSFGHDEYMYQVCVENGCKLPKEGLWCIRYHSAYPWHKEGGYQHLLNDSDQEKLQAVLEFNKYDLYSKRPEIPNIKELKGYYDSLFKKYFPKEKISW